MLTVLQWLSYQATFVPLVSLFSDASSHEETEKCFIRVRKLIAVLRVARHFSVSSWLDVSENSDTRGTKVAWYASHCKTVSIYRSTNSLDASTYHAIPTRDDIFLALGRDVLYGLCCNQPALADRNFLLGRKILEL